MKHAHATKPQGEHAQRTHAKECAGKGDCTCERQMAAVSASIAASTSSISAAPTPVALSTLLPGQQAFVQGAALDSTDAAYLRAMGIRPQALVRMCRTGEPCIVEVRSGGVQSCGSCCCRIGLSRDLADKVLVMAAPMG